MRLAGASPADQHGIADHGWEKSRHNVMFPLVRICNLRAACSIIWMVSDAFYDLTHKTMLVRAAACNPSRWNMFPLPFSGLLLLRPISSQIPCVLLTPPRFG
jgi:hypothetical protein